MTLQSSGQIKFSQIQTEFGGTNPISLGEYYAGGSYVPSGTSGINGSLPSSSTINLSRFYGSTAIPPRWFNLVQNVNSALTQGGTGIVSDSSGNVYVSGSSGDPVETTISTIKYNSSGNIVWQRKLQAGFSIWGTGIAKDSAGYLYGIGVASANGAIFKYSSAGVLQWQKIYGTNYNSFSDIVVDSSGNFYIVGGIDVSAGALNDIHLAKFDTNGNLLWSRAIAGASPESLSGICIDSSSNIYVSGTTESQGAGLSEVFIAKYNSAGVIQWQRRLGSTNWEGGAKMCIDSSGNLYFTGYTYTLQASGHGMAVLVGKYNNSGTLQWQRILYNAAQASEDKGRSITLDAAGNLYITGYTEYGLTAGGLQALTLIKYNNAGVLQWQKAFGTLWYTWGNDIEIDSAGSIFIVGVSRENLYFNNSILVKFTSDGGPTATIGPILAPSMGTSNTYYAGTIALTEIVGTLTGATSTLSEFSRTIALAAGTYSESASTYNCVTTSW